MRTAQYSPGAVNTARSGQYANTEETVKIPAIEAAAQFHLSAESAPVWSEGVLIIFKIFLN